MALVSDLITEIKDTFGDLSDAEYLRLLQSIHTEFLTDLPITATTITETSLVEDTQEYAFDASVLKVWSVRYLRTSTVSDSKQLIPISVDELDARIPNWRGDDSGEPDYFYFRGGNIGLYPKPNASSSGGYPRLSIEVTDSVTLSTGTTMPTTINSFRAWVDECVYRIALKSKDPNTAYYEKAAKDSKARLYRQFHRNARLQTKIVPNLGGSGITRA